VAVLVEEEVSLTEMVLVVLELADKAIMVVTVMKQELLLAVVAVQAQ
jgi:hypothetical protein